MKKFLTLMIAAVMLLGCVNVTAYADENHRGTTLITAVVAPVAYEIVVPQTVNMTEPGIVEVGAPSVKNVTGAFTSTVISYTATGDEYFVATGKSTKMKASYYSDSTGTTPFPTGAVEVYNNQSLVSPLPVIYVGVSEADWLAAEAGQYEAKITFDFNSANNTKKSVSDLLNTVSGGFPTTASSGWKAVGADHLSVFIDDSNLKMLNMSASFNTTIDISTQLTPDAKGYVGSSNNKTWYFVTENNILTSIEIDSIGGELTIFKPNN